jgi:isopenicillin N synthase-like dioxygenase
MATPDGIGYLVQSRLGEEELMDAVPVIDIAPFLDGSDPERVVSAVGAACAQIGFLVVAGHGVQQSTIDAAVAAAREFFLLDADDKRQSLPGRHWYFRGYEPPGGSALARSLDVATPPDLCELFRISRFDDSAPARTQAGDGTVDAELEYFYGANIWPAAVPRLRLALSDYYSALESLAATMMHIFASALDLPEQWFDDKFADHISNLCVNYYPPQRSTPVPGQLRRGAHTDYGSMTVLYQDDAPGGLQVMTKTDGWADVPHVPGTYVVNLGDLLAMWTNDRWVSTMHRVVNPGRADADRDRISIPFFHQPARDAVISCIPTCTSPDDPPHHTPVTSGEWVLTKTRKQVGAA